MRIARAESGLAARARCTIAVAQSQLRIRARGSYEPNPWEWVLRGDRMRSWDRRAVDAMNGLIFALLQ